MDQFHVELPPSAEAWAIATPPPEWSPDPKVPSLTPSHRVDLSNENEIEVVHAQQDVPEDPLQLFEEAAPTTATAAAPAPDESAE